MTKCAYRFGAPDAMMMVRTASPVLHDVWSSSSMACYGRNSAESGGHFGGHDTWSEGTNLRAGSASEREKGGQHVSTDSDVPSPLDRGTESADCWMERAAGPCAWTGTFSWAVENLSQCRPWRKENNEYLIIGRMSRLVE